MVRLNLKGCYKDRFRGKLYAYKTFYSKNGQFKYKNKKN